MYLYMNREQPRSYKHFNQKSHDLFLKRFMILLFASTAGKCNKFSSTSQIQDVELLI